MLKILRLEFLFSRRQVLIVLAVFSAYFAYMASQIDSPRVFIIATSLMVGLSMPSAILAREDRFKTAGLLCSLPVRRSMVVLSKYASTWAAIAIGLGYALLFCSVFPFARISMTDVLTLKMLLISLLLMSLLLAVILPFTIRFGLTVIIILLVASQLLGLVALILAQMLKGAGNPLRVLLSAVATGLKALMNHDGTPGYLLALLAAAIAVNALSFLASWALYVRRDL